MPHVKWFGRDWLGDPLLRMVSPTERGVWMDLLCAMMTAEPYGHLVVNGRPMTDAEAARMVGMSEDAFKATLKAIEDAGISSRTRDGVLFSRRLVRDFEAFLSARAFGKRGGSPQLRQLKNHPQNPLESLLREEKKKPEARSHAVVKGGLKGSLKGADVPVTLSAVKCFDETWVAFLENRVAKRARATPDAQRLLLAKLAQHPDRAIMALETAITRNWTGFEWEWMENHHGNGKPQQEPIKCRLT